MGLSALASISTTRSIPRKDPCAAAYLSAGVDLGASGRPIGLALRGSPKDKVPADVRAIYRLGKGRDSGRVPEGGARGE